MRRERRWAVAAWAWFGLVLALVVGLNAYLLRILPFTSEIFLQTGLVYLGVGALIASRRPANPIGWLFLISGTFVSLPLFTLAEVLRSESGSAGSLAAWSQLVANFSIVPAVFPTLFAVLLFPSGRIPGPRWRGVVGVGVLIMAVITTAVLLAPDAASFDAAAADAIPNPVSPFHGAAAANFEAFVGRLESVFPWLILAFALACAVAPLVRYRSASATERAQIRWLPFAGSLFAVGLVLGVVIGFDHPVAGTVWWIGQLSIPVAVAVAILRHRVFDIDVIIRRSLQYGLLSAILAGIYAGSVLVVQVVLEPIVGGADSPPVVVVTTLALAALFNPLRVRVQRFIDRRFYRRKVSAERALARFAAFARDEVDLEALRQALFGTVGETLQPECMGLWLKPAPSRHPNGESR